MTYSVITLAIAVTSGILLLVFRKQIARFQKAQADKGKGLVNARLRQLPESHLESQENGSDTFKLT